MKKHLQSIIQKTCDDFEWHEIVYAGMAGSSLVTLRNRDIDIVVVTSTTPKNPSMINLKRASLLVFTRDWLG